MHLGIFGMTESGKSTTAKVLIEVFKKKGVSSLLLDPLEDPSFNADFKTSDPDLFMKVVFSSEKCLVIVDESGDAIGHYNPVMQKLATKGRHWGHTCIFLTQKATQIPPIIRDQMGAVFLFGSGSQSCKAIAEEFNSKEFLTGSELKKGEFIYKTRFGSPVRGSIFRVANRIFSRN